MPVTMRRDQEDELVTIIGANRQRHHMVTQIDLRRFNQSEQFSRPALKAAKASGTVL